MKPTHLLWILPAAAAAAAGAARWAWMASAPVQAQREAAPGPDGPSARMAELEARLAELERQLEPMRLRPVVPSSDATSRSQVLDLEAELERWWAKRTAAAAASSASASEAGAQAALLEELLDPRLDPEAKAARLQELRKGGDLDELISQLQDHLLWKPGDASAHLLLAEACIQRIQAGDLGAEAGDLATLADKAFDNALSLDPGNWQARYSKAEALSYWPAAGGKSQEAISQLEILLQQQSGAGLQPHHSQTHLLLGNLYMNSGDKQMALKVWQQGLAQFPSNAALQQQISAYSHP